MPYQSWLALCLACFWTTSASAKVEQAEYQLFPAACGVKRCTVQGRLVRKSRWLKQKKKKSGKFRLFMQAVRRLTRAGIRHTTVKVSLGGQQKVVATDGRGYFKALFYKPNYQTKQPKSRPTQAVSQPASQPASRPSPASSVRAVATSWPPKLSSSPGVGVFRATHDGERAAHIKVAPAEGVIVFPTSDRGVSVISDIDDTLIHTHVTNKRKLLKTFLFRSYAQIKLVPGALSFVKALLKGPKGQGGGTMHYVSGSPTRIFDRVYALFRLRHFPLGSFHLKRLKGPEAHGATQQLAYKLSHILPLFKRYPKRKFVLIGDSGEKDPAVYKKVKARYPNRVKAIYIHHVSKDSPAAARFLGVTLVRSYAKALLDARKRGLVQ